jgi:HEAT repeat protein
MQLRPTAHAITWRVPLKRLICLILCCVLTASCSRKPPYENKSVGELETMTASSDADKQLQGAYGLSLKGEEASAAVPTLIEQLKSDKVLVRQNAAYALGKIGPKARDAVPALVKLLGDPDWRVRRQAAMALGDIGPDARASLPDLKKLRRDKVPTVRNAVNEALAKIEPAKK